jgi:hypothetical protein
MALRQLLYGWFSSRKKPTQQQFKELIDTFWSKEEDKIEIDSVNGLREALQTKVDQNSTGAFRLPVVLAPGVNTWHCNGDTLIDYLLITGPSTDLSIGTTNGSSNLNEAFTTDPKNGIAVVQLALPITTETDIFFNGITPQHQVKIYRR